MDAYVTLGLGIIATVLAGCTAVAARFGSLVAFCSAACALILDALVLALLALALFREHRRRNAAS